MTDQSIKDYECPNCGMTVYVGDPDCKSCNTSLPPIKLICSKCKGNFPTKIINGKEYCYECLGELLDKIITSSTKSVQSNSFNHYKKLVVDSIVIRSSEIVSNYEEFDWKGNDYFGAPENQFSNTLTGAYKILIDRLKIKAMENNVNAVLDIKFVMNNLNEYYISITVSGVLASL